ncbi:MAG: YeeE/YedE family protein [Candidatus Marinimicrobia bacterium]|nr:YeeE/YedE family protein [Candidatus Neomarinimicrobiota bacterium]
MKELLSATSWSPYLAGVGIGVVSWLAFLFSNHPLGVSTAFAKTAGLIEMRLRGPAVAEKLYYRENKPAIDWEWMLVVGLLLGALTAAWLSGTIRWEWVPPMWAAKFGSNVALRLVVAVFGGICVGFGARWGCGCTSGHGISGTLQLVLSSWLAAFCFFVGGMAVAFLLYKVM